METCEERDSLPTPEGPEVWESVQLYLRFPPLFSAKIIYENTTFAKKIRACGAKMKDLAKILENKGGFLH